MDFKDNPQGYLIYAAIVVYMLGFFPALLTAIIKFRKIMTALIKRARVLFFWICVLEGIAACIVAGVSWSRHNVFPSKALLIALACIVGNYVGVCVIGLAAKALASKFRKLHSKNAERLQNVTRFLVASSMVCLSIAIIVIIAAFTYRWYHVKHVPMQNLFEVFLTLGVLTMPISMLCRWFLGLKSLSTDLLLAAVVLFPAGFIFNADPQHLPPALQSWLFTPHVAVYMLSYVLMAKASFQAVFQIWTNGLIEDNIQYEHATYNMVRIGFPLLTLGLILGSYWGKLAWGDYWGWDPKELWSLASWLVFVGYFHYRYMFGKKHPRANSLWALAGMAAIIITLLWVNLCRLFPGLHSYAS